MSHFNAARALLKSFAGEAKDGARDVSDHEALQNRIERQNLVLKTMLVLLLEKEVFTEQEFREFATKMDLLDGTHDGRLGPDRTMLDCPECGGPVRKTAATCPSCGSDHTPDFIPPRP